MGQAVEIGSEFIRVGELCYAGWPGGHCLRVPKEQEVHFMNHICFQGWLLKRVISL